LNFTFTDEIAQNGEAESVPNIHMYDESSIEVCVHSGRIFRDLYIFNILIVSCEVSLAFMLLSFKGRYNLVGLYYFQVYL
jgi:hypothetical protein